MTEFLWVWFLAFGVGLLVFATITCIDRADARRNRRNCQVCSRSGAVVLTDIDWDKYLCPHHDQHARYIATLEANIPGKE